MPRLKKRRRRKKIRLKDQAPLSVVRSSVPAYQRMAKIPKAGRQNERVQTFAVRLTHVFFFLKIGDKEQVKKMMELNGEQERKK